MAAVAQSQDQVRAFVEREGTIIVPRRVTGKDRIRMGLAYVAAATAIGFVAAGFVNPAWVGFAGAAGLLYVTGPALVIAAVLHVLLITTGIRRPMAAFSPAGAQIQGYTLRREEITRVWVDRSPWGNEVRPVLMVGTTREEWPAVAVLPPGYIADDELNALFVKVRKVLG